MADDKEALVPQSYRLPASQVAMIEALAASKIFGTNKSGIVRTLLDRAFKELVETEYVRKHFDTMKRLRGKGRR